MVEHKPDEVPWTIQQTIFGILLTLVPWFIVVSLLNGGKTPTTPSTALPLGTDITNAIVTFLVSSIIEGAFIVAPLYFAKRVNHAITPHLRLAWRALGFKEFNVGKAFILVILFGFIIIATDYLYQDAITLFHWHLQTNDQVILTRSKIEPITTYATLLVAVFVAPFCEEIFFRGFVFTGLRRGMPLYLAVILSALLFAAAHGDPASFPVLLVIGLLLAILRWQTKSLWPGILLHCLNNSLGAIEIILVMHGVIKL
ncbi:MAG: CPBP family glutamic-type intramembrane protease [Ktedonobacteraceae bacterium]